jgi:glycosidase
VAIQRDDPGSTLTLCRDLIALRRRTRDLHAGSYTTLAAPSGAWAWRRGDSTIVAVNLSDADVSVDGISGRILVGTDRDRDGQHVKGRLVLRAWEGAVVG